MLYEDNSTQVSKGMGTTKGIMTLVTGDDLLSIVKLFEQIALCATQEIINQMDALLSDSNIVRSCNILKTTHTHFFPSGWIGCVTCL